jgi:hypothetical protein
LADLTTLVEKMQAARGRPDTGRPAPPVTRPTPVTRPIAADRKSASAQTYEAENGLPKGERIVLTAVAQFGTVARDQLSVLTGFKRSSRNTYVSRLHGKGLITVQGDTLTATAAGVQALGGGWEPLPTGARLRTYWLERLPVGEQQVLSVLVNAYPASVPREQIDELTGYKRSSRNTYLSRLAARRLVESVGPGAVKAAADLF